MAALSISFYSYCDIVVYNYNFIISYGYLHDTAAYIHYNMCMCASLRVLRHAHALFGEPLLGAHISETVVANAIKSKLL